MDAKMQCLLITSKGIRDGWIDTVKILTDTIQNKVQREEEKRAEASAINAIRAAAIAAVRAAAVAAIQAAEAGLEPTVAAILAEETGAQAAVDATL